VEQAAAAEKPNLQILAQLQIRRQLMPPVAMRPLQLVLMQPVAMPQQQTSQAAMHLQATSQPVKLQQLMLQQVTNQLQTLQQPVAMQEKVASNR
jgi:hypothetical protein